MSTHALNELDKDGTAVRWTLACNKRKITNNTNLKKKHLMYNFQITALCISFLYARCGKITFLRQSRPHRACLPPDKAAYIFSIHLGFHCGEYNTQRDTVYHIWSVCPSYFQLTVLFISFAGTGFMEQCGGRGSIPGLCSAAFPCPSSIFPQHFWEENPILHPWDNVGAERKSTSGAAIQ